MTAVCTVYLSWLPKRSVLVVVVIAVGATVGFHGYGVGGPARGCIDELALAENVMGMSSESYAYRTARGGHGACN